ncbi:MAG: hypothetical protein WB586_16305 [Chthoniobacterales bacterium]
MPIAAQEKDTVDPEVRHQIEAVLKQHEEAYNKYNAATFAAGFTEYAVELSSGGTARGRKEIQALIPDLSRPCSRWPGRTL